MKSIRFACVSFAAALIAAACGGSTSSDTGDQGGAGAAGTAGAAGSSGGGTTDGGNGGSQPDGSAGGADGGSAGAGGGAAGAGAGGAGGGFDAGNACNACLSTSCSKELTACQADQACTCWLGCFDGQNFQQCYQQCGQSQAALGFIQCGGQKCGQTCGGGGGQGGSGGGALDGGGPIDSGKAGAGGGASDGGLSQGCQDCMAQSCGQELTACQASKPCTCWAGCFTGQNYVQCYQQCGAPDSATTNFGQCTQQKCGNSCP